MPESKQQRLISVIVPVYNEEWCIVPLYGKVMKSVEAFDGETELIYINDGSTDNTKAALDELAAKDVRVKVVHLKHNQGITAAVMAGIDASAGDVIISMDGNLQNEPQDIPRLLEKLAEGYDVCLGWRRETKLQIIKRRLPNKLANYLISFMSGVYLHDHECSLCAYRREVIQDMKLYGDAHRFIPIFASWNGGKVTEISVTQHPRAHGHGPAQYGFKRAIKMVLDLILLKFRARYAQKPMYVFGLFGLLNFAVSVVAGCLAIYYKFWGGKSFIETPLPLLVVMTLITGGLCILMGLLAEIIVRIYYESEDRSVYLVDERRNLDEK